MKIIKYKYILFVLVTLFSCKKFVEIDPPKTQLESVTIFSDDATAISALLGLYSSMSSGLFQGGFQSITFYTGLSSDEFDNYSTSQEQIEFSKNSLSVNNSKILSLWSQLYKYVYTANSILEGINKSSNMSTSVRKQIEGEIKFIRAYCYFYLVNLYGDVPLLKTTDYRANNIAFRNETSVVYASIISDLTDAQNLLPSDYSVSNNERVRVNKWAATALLARAYLYTKDWTKAEANASLVISTNLYSILTDLNLVFLKNSKESIFQLQPVRAGFNVYDGFDFILTSKPNSGALSNTLVSSFEPGDLRKSMWTSKITVTISGIPNTYYYTFKYKIKSNTAMTEYHMLLRVAEQYLIRAEARAQLNNITGGLEDLNVIRSRAGLISISTNNKLSLLSFIDTERREELFAEWGHRWLDLKRTNKTDNVLNSMKSPNWQPTDTIYPIPQADRLINPNLTQNNGY